MSFKDAKYFDWKGPEFENKNAQQSCTCKSAVGRKKQETGVFSGEVYCLEDAAAIGNAESKMTTASTNTTVPEKATTSLNKATTIQEADTTKTEAAFSPVGCIPLLEINTMYVGIPKWDTFNLNINWENKKPDLEACRTYCMSFKDAKYFDWRGPEFENINARLACACKSAVGKKKQKTGAFSGEVHCQEDAATKGDAESKITSASTNTTVPDKATTSLKNATTIEEAETTKTEAATNPSVPGKTSLEEYTTTGDAHITRTTSTSTSSSFKTSTSKPTTMKETMATSSGMKVF